MKHIYSSSSRNSFFSIYKTEATRPATGAALVQSTDAKVATSLAILQFGPVSRPRLVLMLMTVAVRDNGGRTVVDLTNLHVNRGANILLSLLILISAF